MSERKTGTLTLCCMMIGAVLGSGIVILPPLAIDTAGAWALPAWGLTAAFGVAFAYVFARVGTLFPGEGGAADAVERAFGPGARNLAACTLCGAAVFGPAAVMLTIVDYLPPAIQPGSLLARGAAAAAIQIGCALMLTTGLRTMSRVGTLLAVSATLLLLTGSIVTLALHAGPDSAHQAVTLPPLDPPAMGRTLLLLFWAVVGWEVVGNYGAEVADPRRTVPRAAIMAATVVGLVSLAVAAGLQYGAFPPEAGHGVAGLLHPLFGPLAPWIMSGLVAALCATTYLLIVGAVARLVAHLARDGQLPAALDRRNRHGVPHRVIGLYTLAHLALIALVSQGILDVAGIVTIADGFFLANALLGTLAAARLFTAPLPRTVAALLALGVAAVFTQSAWAVLAAIAAMGLLTLRRPRRRTGPIIGPTSGPTSDPTGDSTIHSTGAPERAG
ncbi:APC family permease [Pseudodesulfovibrio pelocollis]|uniref:APC family permease n=1 Tax=Pseudodesulfovibrio pelocollis TaxID=3051432 RepID=UPI00255B2831|nr:amino acid permease [Pseudodesulfovibrio sp. SB368]